MLPGIRAFASGTMAAMRLDILQVPGCPSAAVLETRLAPLLADHPGIEVTRQVVTTEEDAGRLGITGSPSCWLMARTPLPGLARSRLFPAASTLTSRAAPDRRHHPGSYAKRSISNWQPLTGFAGRGYQGTCR
jgi:hypothetical protein